MKPVSVALSMNFKPQSSNFPSNHPFLGSGRVRSSHGGWTGFLPRIVNAQISFTACEGRISDGEESRE